MFIEFLKYAGLFVCCSLDHNQSHKSTYILPLKYAKLHGLPLAPFLMGVLKKYNKTTHRIFLGF